MRAISKALATHLEARVLFHGVAASQVIDVADARAALTARLVFEETFVDLVALVADLPGDAPALEEALRDAWREATGAPPRHGELDVCMAMARVAVFARAGIERERAAVLPSAGGSA